MKKIVQIFNILLICGLFGSSVFAGPVTTAKNVIRRSIAAEDAAAFEAAVRQYHVMAGKEFLISFFKDALANSLRETAEELAPDVFTKEELEQLGVTPTPEESAEIIAIRAAIAAVGVDAFNDAVRALTEAVRRDDREALIELFREALAVEGWRDAVTVRAREIFTAEERDNLRIPDPTPAPTPPIGGGSSESLDQLLRKATGEQRASQDGTSAADLSDLLSGKKLQGQGGGSEISWPWIAGAAGGILALVVIGARCVPNG